MSRNRIRNSTVGIAAGLLACLGAAHGQTPPPAAEVPPQAAPAPLPAPPVPSAPPTVGSLVNAPDWQAAGYDPGVRRIGSVLLGSAAKADGRSDFQVPLQQGSCYLLSGVGDSTVRRLFLFVWDPGDSRVLTVKPDGAMVRGWYCAAQSGSHHIQLKVAEGRGSYALGVYAAASTGPGAAPNFDALCDARAAAAVPDAVRVTPLLTTPAPGTSRTSWPLNLMPGSCYWMIGVGDTEVGDSKLLLFGPDEKRVAETPDNSPTPALSYCPMVPGLYTLQARIGGKGVYRAAIYSRPLPPPPVAAAMPPAGMQPVAATVPSGAGGSASGSQAAGAFGALAGVVNNRMGGGGIPADMGRACRAGTDCQSGVCANNLCTKQCGDLGGCPAGWSCNNLGGAMDQTLKSTGGSGGFNDIPLMKVANTVTGKVCFKAH